LVLIERARGLYSNETFVSELDSSIGTATTSVVVTVPRDNDFRGHGDDNDDDSGWDH